MMKKISLLMFGLIISVPSFAYSMQIVQPIAEHTVLRPSINHMTVEIATSRPLAPLDTLYIRINGQTIATNQLTFDYDLGQLNFGRHILSAEIQNEKGQIIYQDSRAFNIIINPAITKKVREKELAIQKQAAEDAKPWYKKIGFRFSKDDITVSNDTSNINPVSNDTISASPSIEPSKTQSTSIKPIQGTPTLSSGLAGKIGAQGVKGSVQSNQKH